MPYHYYSNSMHLGLLMHTTRRETQKCLIDTAVYLHSMKSSYISYVLLRETKTYQGTQLECKGTQMAQPSFFRALASLTLNDRKREGGWKLLTQLHIVGPSMWCHFKWWINTNARKFGSSYNIPCRDFFILNFVVLFYDNVVQGPEELQNQVALIIFRLKR